MPSSTDKTYMKPWDIWQNGLDPTADALERVSVLIRREEDWASEYSFSLGSQIRRIANQYPVSMRIGIAMILIEHGDRNAIEGWVSETPPGNRHYQAGRIRSSRCTEER